MKIFYKSKRGRPCKEKKSLDQGTLELQEKREQIFQQIQRGSDKERNAFSTHYQKINDLQLYPQLAELYVRKILKDSDLVAINRFLKMRHQLYLSYGLSLTIQSHSQKWMQPKMSLKSFEALHFPLPSSIEFQWNCLLGKLKKNHYKKEENALEILERFLFFTPSLPNIKKIIWSLSILKNHFNSFEPYNIHH